MFTLPKINDIDYVDGGPVPVRIARDAGADFVIAVDVSSGPLNTTPVGIYEQVMRSFDIMGRSLAKIEAEQADVLIRTGGYREARPLARGSQAGLVRINSRKQFNFRDALMINNSQPSRLAAMACAALLAMNASADVYPSKAITLLVGYPPGGSTDLVARTVAPKLAEALGQPVVIENLGGAGGALAAQKMVNATADGYTLLLGANNEVVIAKLVNKAVRYEPQKDLLPVGLIGSQPMVLVGRPNLGPKTPDELIAYAKQPGNKLAFASSGVGTALHVAGEMVNQQAGIKILHVPYKGAGAMVSDLLGGNIELGVFVLSSALPHIKSGAMRAYGITETKRNAVAPDIPALSETKALEGVDISSWFGLFAPASTPEPVMKRLNSALAQVLASADVKTKLADAGVTLMAQTADRATATAKAFIAADTARIDKVVRAAKIDL